MTTTPPDAPSSPPPSPPTGDTGPRVDRDQVRDLGRLRRSRTDRKVAGVAGGLARHLDVDPLVLRIALVVLVFFGGAGLILYGACWLLVPDEGSDRAAINLDERSRSVALVIVGVIAALALVGDSWGAFWFPWPLALVALATLWLLTRNSPPARPTTPAAPYDQTYGPTYGPTYGQTYDQTYDQTYGPTYAPAAPVEEDAHAGDPSLSASYPPPAYYPPYVPPVRVPNPRKRGPILFWFTLALIALCEGVLGVIDLAGATVADPVYPALAVAICGVMLVVGAFFGRAGGIILVGLIATVGLAGATAADRWDGQSITERPTSAAAVDDRYWLGAGEQVIDLRAVSDLARLDGRTVVVEGGVGRIELILPDGLATTVSADVDGPGNIKLFGEETGGIDITQHDHQGSAADPEVTIDAQLGVGEIEVSYR